MPTQPDKITKIDEMIDEKCRQLNKTGGTSKGGAYHLAKWMKGQLEEVLTHLYSKNFLLTKKKNF